MDPSSLETEFSLAPISCSSAFEHSFPFYSSFSLLQMRSRRSRIDGPVYRFFSFFNHHEPISRFIIITILYLLTKVGEIYLLDCALRSHGILSENPQENLKKSRNIVDYFFMTNVTFFLVENP